MDQTAIVIAECGMRICETVTRLVLLGGLGLGVLACGSAALENKNAPAKSPTPIPPSPERIEEATNVSFSTYSKEWPVGWQWVDPDERYDPTPHNVKKGVLQVNLTTKKNLTDKLSNAPRYIKAISGDFQIETRVKFLPKENYQGAGLLIYSDEANYLRFERSYGGPGGGGSGMRLDVSKNGLFGPFAAPGEIQTDVGEVEMRIVRAGNVFSAYWREDENGEWRAAGEFESDYPDTIMAGIAASNTAREVTAEFAYIRLLPAARK